MKKLMALLLALMLVVPTLALAETTWESEDLTWKKDTSPATFSLFHNIGWAPMDVWGKDHVSQQVTKDTGIFFDVTKQQDAQQLATYVATGELPDAVFVYGSKNIDMMENSTVCYPWDELIDQYAPEFWDLIDKTDIQMATKDDGHFYTLYTHVRNQDYWDDPTQGLTYGQVVLALRDDVMAELGNPEIKSVEDFEEVLKQVHALHPEMVPYLQQRDNGTFISECFGIDYDGAQGHATIDENGNAIWVYSERDVVEPYIQYENRLLREGLMSQEGLTYSFEQAKAAILSGNVFCWSGQAYDIDQVNEALDALEGEEKLYYTALREPLTVNGEIRMDLTWGSAGFAGFFITKNCKDPGRLIALMEYMRSPYADELTQWGVEGLDYELAGPYPIQYDTYSWAERGDNVWYFQATFARENMKALGFAVQKPRFGQTANLIFDFKPFWHYDVSLAMCQNAAANTEEGDIFALLDNLRINSFDAAIAAKTEEECQTIINKFYKDIENVGIDTYNKFINDQYQAIKAKNAQ